MSKQYLAMSEECIQKELHMQKRQDLSQYSILYIASF